MKKLKTAILLFFVILVPLAAKGKSEEPPAVVNAEYKLCITAIDVSDLPVSQQSLGLLFQRELANRMRRIKTRVRGEQELSRYEELAWSAVRKAAAGGLAEKRDQRDTLLFQGLPRWKYKKELQRIDGEIAELEKAFVKADTERPVVEEKPLFVLANVLPGISGGQNDSSVEAREDTLFPPPPRPGGEEAFLTSQGADAFIAGKMRSMYGRVYTELFLYTRSGTFYHEDTLIFSPEDILSASDELIESFVAAASGTIPARLTVKADPEDAWVLVNGNPVHDVEELEILPGELTVSVSAEGYKTVVKETELTPGETMELDIALNPLSMERLGVSMPGVEEASVYLGALYIGKLSDFPGLEIPQGSYAYVNTETEAGNGGRAIVLGGEAEDRVVVLAPQPVPPQDKKTGDGPVEIRRKKFYGAFGRFRVMLPVAFLINGFFQAYVTGSGYNAGSVHNQDLYDSAILFQKITIGAWVGAGVFLAESLVRLVFYIRAADKEAVPLFK
jgi:hypothetical protein